MANILASFIIFLNLSAAGGGGGGGRDNGISFWDWTLKREIDLGNFLTVLTLAGGIATWFFTTLRDRHKKRREDARSGALRLLLKILRENAKPLGLPTLKKTFESPEYKNFREGYCGEDFQFENESEFESAVYRLDWEGKVDFLSPNEIAFRMRERFAPSLKPTITIVPDKSQILAVFKRALDDDKTQLWDLEPLAEAALRWDPDVTSKLLKDAMAGENIFAQRKAAGLLAKFPIASVVQQA
jgi:hypothetical protein